MIGLLSPLGIFYECESWGHTSLAKNILKELNIESNLDDYSGGEDTLLKLGYIVFRARDAYRLMWLKNDPVPLLITDEQIKFLSEHIEEITSLQAKDISDMLIDDEELKHTYNLK